MANIGLKNEIKKYSAKNRLKILQSPCKYDVCPDNFGETRERCYLCVYLN